MSLGASIYSKVPVWAQNVIVSAYGLRLRQLRYGRGQLDELNRLRQSQWLSRTELDRLQASMLNDQLRRALTPVPFYRQRGGLLDRDLRSLGELREIPLLHKDDLRTAETC